jgi:hypothetical protein
MDLYIAGDLATEVEMKATVLRFTAMLAVVMAFTAVSAYGQSTIKRQTFVVPFQFNVGQKVLPAGEYRFNGEGQAIRIQSKDGKQVVTELPLRTIAAKLSGSEVKLTFKRYGDQYYLSQVWLADGFGRELRRKRPTEFDVARIPATVEISGNSQ